MTDRHACDRCGMTYPSPLPRCRAPGCTLHICRWCAHQGECLDGKHVYRCASPHCPGFPYRASDYPHPPEVCHA